MNSQILSRVGAALLLSAALGQPAPLLAADAQVLGWNNLGMHCMDSDYSVFSVLPPYNTIEAQLIVNGVLITNGTGYSVTYEAVADPIGSFNATAIGKGNFYTFSGALYGATPAPEMGLAGWAMPGPGNNPQSMLFEQTNHPAAGVSTPVNWWRAEGIPLSPYDDVGHKNPYPMMRLVARDAGNNIIATNNIVLPVSDEMDCRACHASGSYTNARPLAGWVQDSDPERDFRLNILLLHDEKQFGEHESLYTNALAARGFDPQGLYYGVVSSNKPVLCAACHASEALGAPSYSTIPPLTASVHGRHAAALDPISGITLNDSLNRAACYRCHPGSTTRCLRGAMGAAVAADGSMAIQCQSCHGTMSQVGATNRVGWFMEPSCQSCHSGTATSNNGQIRYPSVFTDAKGTVRIAVDQTFATQPDTPAPGLSLYRFSAGHGGLQCEACHGSTHAEFPSTHLNDNIRNLQLQGHAGVLVECTTCHTAMPDTVNGGPHGMHPVGQDWVNRHPGLLEGNSASRTQCQACHGTDYRGTVLSRAQADRQLTASIENGSAVVQLFRGAIVGCFACHNGPNDDTANNHPAPVATNVATNTAVGQRVIMTLPASGVNLSLHIISQPAHGTVGLNNSVATYFPDPGFTGVDTFTFAAYDGSKNSALAIATVAVGTIIDQSPPTIRITSPTSSTAYGTTISDLTVSGTATDNVAVVSVTWTNDRGGNGTALGTANWTASGIPLQNGLNVLTVTAYDAANHSGTDTLTVTYTPAPSFILITNGVGTVSPDLTKQKLQIGTTYSIRAKPGAGYVFLNWTGSLTSSAPMLTFAMQSSMIVQANFQLNPFTQVAGTFNGLFYEGTGVRLNSAGSLTVTVTSAGKFSGKLQTAGARYPLSGQFDASGHAHAPLARPGMNPLSVEMQLDLTSGTDRVTGTVSDGTWTADLAGDRAVFDGKGSLSPQRGQYTIILPAGAGAFTEPDGIGCGSVSVDKAGRVRLNGNLADGSKVALQTTVARSRTWPVYTTLYSGQGAILGWMTFTNTASVDLSGEFNWFRTAHPGAQYYPEGFAIAATASGSAYTRPPAGGRLLSFTNGVVVLDGGNLEHAVTNFVNLSSNNQITSTNKTSLSIALPTGLFKGTVTTSAAAKRTFSGVLMQKQNAGWGYPLAQIKSDACISDRDRGIATGTHA